MLAYNNLIGSSFGLLFVWVVLVSCCLFWVHGLHLSMIPSTSTKRGFGECPQCRHAFSNRWKPANCAECGFHLGGTKEPASKKPKICCPSAVVVISTEESTIISTKTSTRDDRCFVLKEGDSVFCTHKDCMNVRASFVSSGRSKDFSCKHSDQCTDAVHAQESFELSAEKIEKYNGDSASKEMLTALLGGKNSMAVVVKVSDVSFAVLGFPSTNNTLGYRLNVCFGVEKNIFDRLFIFRPILIPIVFMCLKC